MNRNPLGLVVAAATVLLALPALVGAQQPEMTAAQKAEMEAYAKAGTPGAPHQAMAATVGSYDAKVKSWQDPGQPPMSRPRQRRARWRSRAVCWSRTSRAR